MGHHSHSHHHNHDSSDGVSQRVNSPRFSGPMTRRAHSFKRNNNNTTAAHTTPTNNRNTHITNTNNSTSHEIDLQVNSPGSESVDVFERQSHHQHIIQRVNGVVVKSLLNKKGGFGSAVVDYGFRERKKLGQWMFFVFCGVCLFLGVLKICANGWFGSVLERASSHQVTSYNLFPL